MFYIWLMFGSIRPVILIWVGKTLVLFMVNMSTVVQKCPALIRKALVHMLWKTFWEESLNIFKSGNSTEHVSDVSFEQSCQSSQGDPPAVNDTI